MKKKVAVLGSTGSIGINSLDVIERLGDRFEIVSLAAMKNSERLAQQALKFKPRFVAVADERHHKLLDLVLAGSGIDTGSGEKAVIRAAVDFGADIIISAVSGSGGLKPTYAAVQTGATVAIANKESLAMAGKLLMNAAREHGTTILPIDSEHSAVFQALQAGEKKAVKRIILTASGGPFFHYKADQLNSVTPKEAMKHPVWDMGAKVSIDSATMANKGIEVMEAAVLFDIPCEKIDVVVHPQSIVHSMVEYIDGSVIAQMGFPDMRVPIQYALTWPERYPGGNSNGILFNGETAMQFIQPKNDLFPALPLAYKAIKMGECGTIAYNAADEEAVEAFVKGKISFSNISEIIAYTLEQTEPVKIKSLDDILGFANKTKINTSAFIEKNFVGD